MGTTELWRYDVDQIRIQIGNRIFYANGVHPNRLRWREFAQTGNEKDWIDLTQSIKTMWYHVAEDRLVINDEITISNISLDFDSWRVIQPKRKVVDDHELHTKAHQDLMRDHPELQFDTSRVYPGKISFRVWCTARLGTGLIRMSEHARALGIRWGGYE